MNAKIRNAQKMQVPYMLVVGDREMQENTVSLRKRDGSQVNDLPFDEFVALIKDRYASRSPEL
jgi:threonyl-tRNA synthetase